MLDSLRLKAGNARLGCQPKFQQNKKMRITINIPDAMVEKIVRGIMDNFPEAGRGNSMNCQDCNYTEMKFTFLDAESGETYRLNKNKIMATLRLLFSDQWPNGCTPPPASDVWEQWEEWLCRADATDFDAFVQLACLGKVIYG